VAEAAETILSHAAAHSAALDENVIAILRRYNPDDVVPAVRALYGRS
jgi:hypothetical protein